jgi:hypothetical protein
MLGSVAVDRHTAWQATDDAGSEGVRVRTAPKCTFSALLHLPALPWLAPVALSFSPRMPLVLITIQCATFVWRRLRQTLKCLSPRTHNRMMLMAQKLKDCFDGIPGERFVIHQRTPLCRAYQRNSKL